MAQIVNEEENLLIVVSICEHQTFLTQKFCILWSPLNVKLLNLIGQVFQARGNQSLKINSAHVFEFFDEIGVFGLVH